MRARKIMLVAAVLAVPLTLGGCNEALLQKWESTVASIRGGVRISADVASQMLNEVCANRVAIQQASTIAISVAESRRGPGPNPRTDRLIADINTSMAGLDAACSVGSTTSNLANLAVRAWAAYQAVIAAQAAARAA